MAGGTFKSNASSEYSLNDEISTKTSGYQPWRGASEASAPKSPAKIYPHNYTSSAMQHTQPQSLVAAVIAFPEKNTRISTRIRYSRPVDSPIYPTN